VEWEPGVRIVIVGCGRLGARLVMDAAEQGHEVSIVDNDPRSFRRLPSELAAVVVLGTGIDEDVLKSARIEQADTFIAVTDNDNTNIMAAQIAQRVFSVQNVILRVYDPARADTYRQLGLTVICPTSLVADLIEAELPGFRQFETSISRTSQ
jgi:trk system potassium uptake protein